jgi:hypothetical protein
LGNKEYSKKNKAMWFGFGFSSCNMDKPVFGFGVVLVL